MEPGLLMSCPDDGASVPPACRLCLCERTEEAQGLMKACGCRGTLAYVHAECLALWLRKQGYAAGVWSSPWVLVAAEQVVRVATRRSVGQPADRLSTTRPLQELGWAYAEQSAPSETTGKWMRSLPRFRKEEVSQSYSAREGDNRLWLFRFQIGRFLRACFSEWMILLGSPRILLASWCPRFVRQYWSSQRLRCELCGTAYAPECTEAVIWHWLAMEAPSDMGFEDTIVDMIAGAQFGPSEAYFAQPDAMARSDAPTGEKWSLPHASVPKLASAEARLVFLATANAAMQMHERLMRRVVRSYRIERPVATTLHASRAASPERLERGNALGFPRGADAALNVESEHDVRYDGAEDWDIVLADFPSWTVQTILRSIVVIVFIAACVLVLFVCGVLSELALCAVTDEPDDRLCQEPRLVVTAATPARSVVIGMYALAVTIFLSKLFAVTLCFARAASQRMFQTFRESIRCALAASRDHAEMMS